MTPQSTKESRLAIPAKVIAGSAVAVMLGFGLCNAGHFNFEGSYSPITNAGVFFFLGGLLCGGVGVLWLIAAAITGRSAE